MLHVELCCVAMIWPLFKSNRSPIVIPIYYSYVIIYAVVQAAHQPESTETVTMLKWKDYSAVQHLLLQ